MTHAIKVEKLNKIFKIPKEKRESVREHIFNLFKKNPYETLNVLNNVSFKVFPGEFFGIIGRNGSGKSTLLKILSNIYYPNSGEVDVKGRIAPFLELGVGFNGELTGKENVFLNASVLGLSEKKIREKYFEIVEFAELHKFMSQKLKNYSSGMQVRLAFSVAMQSDADVYLLDEVLAVGDAAFQMKCFEKFKELKSKGKTIVFVSHDLSSMRKFCDRVLYLEEGGIKLLGNTDEVLDKYLEDNSKDFETEIYKKPTNEVVLKSVVFKDQNGCEKLIFSSTEKITMEINVESEIFDDYPTLGFIIYDENCTFIFSTNNNLRGKKLFSLRKGPNKFIIQFKDLHLLGGKYFVTVALSDKDCKMNYLWKDKIASFTLNNNSRDLGIGFVDLEFL